MKIKVNVEIHNMPEDVTEDYVVVRRAEDYSFWFYGEYETKERAIEVARELSNGFVIERAVEE